jgi:hypothetical protein
MRVDVTDYYFAALLDTAGYWLTMIEITPERTSVFSFDMPHLASHDEMLQAYESGEQGLTDILAYVNSLKKLTRLQKTAREHGGQWNDHNWITGKRGEQ